MHQLLEQFHKHFTGQTMLTSGGPERAFRAHRTGCVDALALTGAIDLRRFAALDPSSKSDSNPKNPLDRHTGEGRYPAMKHTPRSGQNDDVVPLAREIISHLDSGLRRNDIVFSNKQFRSKINMGVRAELFAIKKGAQLLTVYIARSKDRTLVNTPEITA